jgi:hypothetical protein
VQANHTTVGSVSSFKKKICFEMVSHFWKHNIGICELSSIGTRSRHITTCVVYVIGYTKCTQNPNIIPRQALPYPTQTQSGPHEGNQTVVQHWSVRVATVFAIGVADIHHTQQGYHSAYDMDASSTQLGAVIAQDNRSIAFFSRKLSKMQQKYSVTEIEFLSMCVCVLAFRL